MMQGDEAETGNSRDMEIVCDRKERLRQRTLCECSLWHSSFGLLNVKFDVTMNKGGFAIDMFNLKLDKCGEGEKATYWFDVYN